MGAPVPTFAAACQVEDQCFRARWDRSEEPWRNLVPIQGPSVVLKERAGQRVAGEEGSRAANVAGVFEGDRQMSESGLAAVTTAMVEDNVLEDPVEAVCSRKLEVRLRKPPVDEAVDSPVEETVDVEAEMEAALETSAVAVVGAELTYPIRHEVVLSVEAASLLLDDERQYCACPTDWSCVAGYLECHGLS